MAVSLTPFPPVPPPLSKLNGRRNFGVEKKVPFSLKVQPLPPPLNGTAIKKTIFFAASLVQTFFFNYSETWTIKLISNIHIIQIYLQKEDVLKSTLSAVSSKARHPPPNPQRGSCRFIQNPKF